MKKHLKHLRYLIRHKWFVLVECWKVGLYWQGIVHDWSKFLPSEWFPYTDFLYGDIGSRKIAYAFDVAVLKHYKRSNHHWQSWIFHSQAGMKPMEMSYKDCLEMICDWHGAGRAKGEPNTKAWWNKNKDNIILHSNTRKYIELCLEEDQT